MNWAFQQGVYNTRAEQSVLVYLAAHAFLSENNKENAPRGHVLRYKSNFKSISDATAICSKNTVRDALTGLQRKGYIVRRDRLDATPTDAPEIVVLWEEEHDLARDRLREAASVS